MDHFLNQLREKNLCTWYLLPLADVCIPEDLGMANVVNSYIILGAQMRIGVQVIDMNLCAAIGECKTYMGTTVTEHMELLIFRIPRKWQPDYFRFLSGKYSKMSTEAKERIIQCSGLKYMQKLANGDRVTDAVLMGLERHSTLRKKWESTLAVHLSANDELLSIPRRESFISLYTDRV